MLILSYVNKPRVDFITKYNHVLILYLNTTTYWFYNWIQSRVDFITGCNHVLIIYLNTITCWFYNRIQSHVDFITGYNHVLIIYLNTITCWLYTWIHKWWSIIRIKSRVYYIPGYNQWWSNTRIQSCVDYFTKCWLLIKVSSFMLYLVTNSLIFFTWIY